MLENITLKGLFFCSFILAGLCGDSAKATLTTKHRQPVKSEVASSDIVEIQVADYTKLARDQAFEAGIKEVLGGLGLSSELMDRSEIKELFSKSSNYVKQFNYLTIAGDSSKQQLLLKIEFNKSAINEIARKVMSSANSAKRQSVLVWVAYKQLGGNNKLLTLDNNPKLLERLIAQANSLSLQLTFPIYDLQDLSYVTADDLCKFNVTKIKTASLRYQIPVVVAGCVSQLADNSYNSSWQLLQSEEQLDQFSFTALGEEEVLFRSLTGVIDKLSATSVSQAAPSEVSSVVLVIDGVAGLAQHRRLANYFKKLSPMIIGFEILEVNSSNVKVELKVVGGRKALLEILADHSHLLSSFEVPNEFETVLRYYWHAS